MSDLSPDETAVLIDYARRCYAQERWPLTRELRHVRAAIDKLRGNSALPPPKPPGEPTWKTQVKQRARR